MSLTILPGFAAWHAAGSRTTDGPAMKSLYTLIGAYWVAMTLVRLMVMIHPRPLARWFLPRIRYWRNWPDAQRLCERFSAARRQSGRSGYCAGQ
jgi:hypothetical protein